MLYDAYCTVYSTAIKSLPLKTMAFVHRPESLESLLENELKVETAVYHSRHSGGNCSFS